MTETRFNDLKYTTMATPLQVLDPDGDILIIARSPPRPFAILEDLNCATEKLELAPGSSQPNEENGLACKAL